MHKAGWRCRALLACALSAAGATQSAQASASTVAPLFSVQLNHSANVSVVQPQDPPTAWSDRQTLEVLEELAPVYTETSASELFGHFLGADGRWYAQQNVEYEVTVQRHEVIGTKDYASMAWTFQTDQGLPSFVDFSISVLRPLQDFQWGMKGDMGTLTNPRTGAQWPQLPALAWDGVADTSALPAGELKWSSQQVLTRSQAGVGTHLLQVDNQAGGALNGIFFMGESTGYDLTQQWVSYRSTAGTTRTVLAAPVPEPGVLLMGALGAWVAVGAARRQRRSTGG